MNQQIIMNFSKPPSDDDISVIAKEQLENLPDELNQHVENLVIQLEEVADETIISDLDLDDSFELLAFYKGGKELSPGIEKKGAGDDDVLVLYRRPLLDAWCESGEDLTQVIREAMIEEIANYFDFSDDDIEDFVGRHYQGMLG